MKLSKDQIANQQDVDSTFLEATSASILSRLMPTIPNLLADIKTQAFLVELSVSYAQALVLELAKAQENYNNAE